MFYFGKYQIYSSIKLGTELPVFFLFIVMWCIKDFLFSKNDSTNQISNKKKKNTEKSDDTEAIYIILDKSLKWKHMCVKDKM